MARVASILALAAVISGSDDDYLRLILERPAATPFAVVHYEVGRRGRATTAVHRRELPGLRESLHAMGLLTREEADALWALAADTDAARLPDAGPPLPGPLEGLAWRVEVSIDGVQHSFRVTDPANQRDRRYHRLVSRICGVVHRVAGELPFRDVFFPEAELGWISVTAIPAAAVSIDGFDTQLETPLFSYELAGGEHEVRLRSLDGGLDRTYQVRVEPGGTTHLTVDLR